MKAVVCSLLLTFLVGGALQAQDTTKSMSHKAHKMSKKMDKDAKKGMDKADKKMMKDEKKMKSN